MNEIKRVGVIPNSFTEATGMIIKVLTTNPEVQIIEMQGENIVERTRDSDISMVVVAFVQSLDDSKTTFPSELHIVPDLKDAFPQLPILVFTTQADLHVALHAVHVLGVDNLYTAVLLEKRGPKELRDRILELLR